MRVKKLVAAALCASLFFGAAPAQALGSSEAALKSAYEQLPPQVRNNPGVKNAARQMGLVKETPAPRASEKPKEPEKPKDCSNCVALTFDDGPGAHTTRLLALLERKNATASFMVTAGNANRNPKVLQRMARNGMTIGNHSISHSQMSKQSAQEIANEITTTNAAIQRATGITPRWLRPPYGDMNATVTRVATAHNVAIALWDVDTLDWKYRNPDRTCRVAVGEARPGSIILMHDIHATTVDAVSCIIDGLRTKDLEPATLDQLIPDPQPGKTYTRK